MYKAVLVIIHALLLQYKRKGPLHYFYYYYFIISQLQKALGEDLTKVNLVHSFASLLKDPEAEVRAAASNRLKGMTSRLGPRLGLYMGLRLGLCMGMRLGLWDWD